MAEFREITDALIKFRDERDWSQFHNAKDLAIALNIESSELLELFLWKSADEADRQRVREELADVLAYSFLLADKFDFDVKQMVLDKININAEKYPADKSKGNSSKYTEFK